MYGGVDFNIRMITGAQNTYTKMNAYGRLSYSQNTLSIWIILTPPHQLTFFFSICPWYSNTHTHTTFNGPFSRTTRVSRYQKGKTNLDFTEARDSEWQWHQLGCMQVCTSPQTDNHATTSPSVFYTPDALPAAQPTASKHWRQLLSEWGLLHLSHLLLKRRLWEDGENRILFAE